MQQFLKIAVSVMVSFTLLLTGYSESLAAQFDFQWTKTVSASAWGCSFGIAMDSSGNLCTAGMSDGTVLGVNSSGTKDYVAKYSPSGTLLWGKQWASTGSTFTGVAADSAGNVLIAEWGVKKFDTAGNLMWQANVNQSPNGIALDPAGNAYTGGFTGAGYPSVSKVDPAGNCLWTSSMTSLGLGNAWSIAVDSQGNSVIAGHSNYTNNTQYGFAAKFDPSGNLLWKKKFGSLNGYSNVTRVAIDGSGDVYLTGAGMQVPGSSTNNVLVKYDPAGNQQWVRDIGYDGMASSLAIDSSGSAFLSTGYRIEKYDPSGNLIDQYSIPNHAVELAYGNGAVGMVGIQNSPYNTNVSYYVVPEPSAFVLMGMGIAFLTIIRLKKR